MLNIKQHEKLLVQSIFLKGKIIEFNDTKKNIQKP